MVRLRVSVLRRWGYRLWLVVLLAGTVGACKSTQGAGVIKAERIKDRTATAWAILKDSNLTEKEKATVKKVFEEIDSQAEDLGKDRDKEAVKAEANASAASKWRWFVGILIAVSVLAAMWFGRGFIMRILSGGIAK